MHTLVNEGNGKVDHTQWSIGGALVSLSNLRLSILTAIF